MTRATYTPAQREAMPCPQCQGEGALFRGKTPIDACRMCSAKAEVEWQAARLAKRLEGDR